MATKSTATIDDGIELPSKGSSEHVSIDEGRKPEPQKFGGFEIHSPGDIGGDSDYIDAGTDTGSGAAPKRRGRPRGSRNASKTETKTASNIGENLEHLLLSVHLMGAALLKLPELAIDPTEAEKLASAIREVLKHYPISLDPKRVAWIELGTMAAMIYGTRGIAVYQRSKRKPAIVTEMPKPQKPAESRPAQTTTTQVTNAARTPGDLFGLGNGVEDLSQL